MTVYSANPRYLVNSGTPVVILGADTPLTVIKSANYRASIDFMAAHKVNYGRVWTVTPWAATESYFPWARDGGGGANDGLQKYNLTHWDTNFWSRLKDACAYAQSKDVYLSIILFDECGIEAPTSSSNHRWDWHPFNPTNNVDGLSLPTSPDAVPEAYSLANAKLIYLQELYVDRMIRETSGYPNVIYEICNEYTGPWDWEKHWIDYVRARCSNVIAVNRLSLTPPSAYWTEPKIGMVNMHLLTLDPKITNQYITGYTTNPSTPKAVNYDETPEKSSNTFAQYRAMAWASFVGGGHIHLECNDSEPAADAILNLRRFIADNGVRFWEMSPSNSLVTRTPGGGAYTLAKAGSEYVVYIAGSGGGSMVISLAPGFTYTARAHNPSTGAYTNLSVSGNTISGIPSYSQDIVIYVKMSGQATSSSPNVSLTLAVDKTTAVPGDTLSYTLSYRNAGNGDARSVAITSPLSQHTTYVPGSASSSGAYDSAANAVRWSISNIAPGASGSLTFKVTMN